MGDLDFYCGWTADSQIDDAEVREACETRRLSQSAKKRSLRRDRLHIQDPLFIAGVNRLPSSPLSDNQLYNHEYHPTRLDFHYDSRSRPISFFVSQKHARKNESVILTKARIFVRIFDRRLRLKLSQIFSVIDDDRKWSVRVSINAIIHQVVRKWLSKFPSE